MLFAFALLIYGHNRLPVYEIVGAAVGVYLFCRGFFILQRKRLIVNTPASKVRSASMGLVEISGLAAGPRTIPAAVTGVPCYFHHSMAWEWRREGKNNTWVKVAEETVHVPFYIDDNTGRVLVDPQGAEMSIHRDFCDEFSQSLFSSSLDVPANVASFLSRHGVSYNRKIKVEEYCIKPKNALFVLGTLAENHIGYNEIPVSTYSAESTQIRWRVPGWSPREMSSFTVGANPRMSPIFAAAQPVASVDQQMKMAGVLMSARITNPVAWAAAGIQSAAATAPALATDEFDLHPPVVLKKGEHNPAFFISWQSQRDVVHALALKSAWMIWGGPALTLLCVYLLFAQFGQL